MFVLLVVVVFYNIAVVFFFVKHSRGLLLLLITYIENFELGLSLLSEISTIKHRRKWRKFEKKFNKEDPSPKITFIHWRIHKK